MECVVDLDVEDEDGRAVGSERPHESPPVPEMVTAEEISDAEHRVTRARLDLTRAEEHLARLLSTKRKEDHERSERKSQETASRLGDSRAWDASVTNIARELFGITSFRRLQREAINAVMDGVDVLALMPTGSGKSLVFQLPAVLLGGITLVVSPLIALMQDQVQQMQELRVSARLFEANLSREEKKAFMDAITCTEHTQPGEGTLLYVTPERVVKSKTLINRLQTASARGHFQRIVIDEAHCCSQWGHDFRRDYSQLGVLRNQFPDVAMVLLTASASPQVRRDMFKILHLTAPVVLQVPMDRPNLLYEVRAKAVDAAVVDDVAELATSRPWGRESGLVYVFSRKDADRIADDLRGRHRLAAAAYHSQLSSEERRRVHQRWSSGAIQIVVATIAFGLGINKTNVRFVVHATISKNLESYYQESGRAGRDGKLALCRLYWQPADLFRVSVMQAESANRSQAIALLYAMGRYAVATTCRRAALLAHFQEKPCPRRKKDDDDDDGAQSCCDNCARPKDIAVVDVSELAATLARILQSVHERASTTKQLCTLNQLIDAWGATSPAGAWKRYGQPQAPKDFPRRSRLALVVQLVLDGIAQEVFHYTPYSIISYLQPSEEDIARFASVWDGTAKVSLRIYPDQSSQHKSPVSKKRKRRATDPKLDTKPVAAEVSTPPSSKLGRQKQSSTDVIALDDL